jgi:hypothetical protein
LPVLAYPTRHQNSGTVISTEAARAFGEQRSGEIRFSTTDVSPSTSRRVFKRSSKRNPQKYFKKVACFSAPDSLVFPAALSPQIHHDLPSKNHVLHTQKSQNPLQKRPSTTPGKNP